MTMKCAAVFYSLLVGFCCSEYTQYNLGKALDTYDNDEPPPGKTTVRVGLYINQMQLTDEATMKIVAYVRQSWKDERLAGIGEKVRLVGERYRQIWRPDTFFRNAITAGRRNNGLTVEQLTRINSTGHVWHVMTIEGEFGCPMLHSHFSNLTCGIMMESYGYTTDTLEYVFLNNPVDLDPQIHLKGVVLDDIILRDCTQNYSAGSFPCQETNFIFRRDQTCR